MSLRRVRRVGVMTEENFDAVVGQFPRLSAVGKLVARQALVDGISQVELADLHRRHRQQISRWVNMVYARYQESLPQLQKLSTGKYFTR